MMNIAVFPSLNFAQSCDERMMTMLFLPLFLPSLALPSKLRLWAPCRGAMPISGDRDER